MKNAIYEAAVVHTTVSTARLSQALKVCEWLQDGGPNGRGWGPVDIADLAEEITGLKAASESSPDVAAILAPRLGRAIARLDERMEREDRAVVRDIEAAWSKDHSRVLAALEAAGLKGRMWEKGSYRRVYPVGPSMKGECVELDGGIGTRCNPTRWTTAAEAVLKAAAAAWGA